MKRKRQYYSEDCIGSSSRGRYSGDRYSRGSYSGNRYSRDRYSGDRYQYDAWRRRRENAETLSRGYGSADYYQNPDSQSFTMKLLEKISSKYSKKRNFRVEKTYATVCNNVKFDSAVRSGEYREVL